ncbi:tRNA-dihydrouridine(20) synthase [NAD(P)+]-like [Bradysia coprophila]|uniref:tRNA-dihydrouridine(20) synthase [NAD(P)+]-like n=1 Tax=Bradysia coprophila TaxID=38358 RepID=UPI00187D972F|nr:tRNA-dihydrouridine(20) synthase [NAD(P)+]-like [Bradysia coprophila]
MKSKSIINYCNKLILAPMVRGSLLPMRLLALRYGADLVYTDEIIDLSMLQTTRRVNSVLGTIDFINEDSGCLLFRTCPAEKQKLIFQIGTSDPTRAIKVVKMVENDVSGIDINMGCPKPYSTSLGIGAALLSNVKVAKRIVQGLVENIDLPVTCKIRVSDDIEQTLNMVKDFETLGVSAITVHGRTRYQRSSEPVNKDAIRKIAESVRIPIIANGGSLDIKDFSDIDKFKEDCGATSVMVARAALQNVSVFRKEGTINVQNVITEYLKLCVDFDQEWRNVEYCLRQMLSPLGKVKKSPIGKEFEAAESLEALCDIWNLGDYCREKQSDYKSKGIQKLSLSPPKGINTPIELILAREEKFSQKNIIHERMQYRRHFFDLDRLPKFVLHKYCVENNIPLPTYDSTRIDRQFNSIITMQDKQYASVFLHKDSRNAQQAAALVCCYHLGFYEEDFLVSMGCLYQRYELASIAKL